ncbi:probable 2-oxoglutarate-dependent dioxygenase AOP1 [Rutidosis leptorrhynchoides]|uniref:probable 2-oxoglutarate-dependent dioxygenase AOP1 n=1 Tax=Rutidosis leptorrhynchoides TaxID=125765 RepID=UPI003A98E55C
MRGLKPGNESWMTASHKVRRALEEYDFFMAIYEGVSAKLMKEVVDAMETVFELPKETKLKNTCDNPDHGYIGLSDIRPNYESLGFKDATNLDNVQHFENLMWPSGNNKYFSKTMHSYVSQISKLEKMVRNMVFESYGVEKYSESYNQSMCYNLKFSKYSKRDVSVHNSLAVRAHTDKTFISILGQNHMNGLQVQMKDGEWVTIDYLPSSFVVNVGDAFMTWSNGRLKSPLHRVIATKEDRYSVLVFVFKRGIIEIPKELNDDEHPQQFKPFDHLAFSDNRSKDPNCLDERAIKMYCVQMHILCFDSSMLSTHLDAKDVDMLLMTTNKKKMPMTTFEQIQKLA